MGYLCVHGHFYQPPRENPWLEAIELQDSASPCHDWNERITEECYAPNTASRILDSEGKIVKLVNNYARISFDFGPTLLAWMEEKAPEVYQAILAADRESQKAFSGHGNALAEPYNHVILPLANQRDKYTQVCWGIRDFEYRFGRPPEGMWLPETAVDMESLEILAELGIQFTILAPHQALRIHRIGSRVWQDVTGGRIDPTMVYELRLPSGRTINVFFYDGPISLAVAFEDLLNNGECFAHRLLSGFSEDRTWPEIVHIATDGETYGHHHRHGDMALAYAYEYITSTNLAQITNYGAYLERHPPSYMVEILDNTSWSCPHGVERWRSNCGCRSWVHPGWEQTWRAPLREALDWLRDTLTPGYETHGGRLVKDSWAARNDYIDVVLDRSPETLERFLSQHAAHELEQAEKITALKLLEVQRHAMLMYTSCGWFFDELSGIETVQVMQHAGRAVQLAEEILGDALEARFLERLEQAKSNVSEHQDGRRIYERFVRPAMGAKPLVASGSHKFSNSFHQQLERLQATESLMPPDELSVSEQPDALFTPVGQRPEEHLELGSAEVERRVAALVERLNQQTDAIRCMSETDLLVLVGGSAKAKPESESGARVIRPPRAWTAPAAAQTIRWRRRFIHNFSTGDSRQSCPRQENKVVDKQA